MSAPGSVAARMKALSVSSTLRQKNGLSLLKNKLNSARGIVADAPPRRAAPAAPVVEVAHIQLQECGVCGRSFSLETFPRHAKICKRALTKRPRKVFNTTEHRVRGTEFAQFTHLAKKAAPAAAPGAVTKTKKWKAQSEQLRNALSSARKSGVSAGPSSDDLKQREPIVDASLVKCNNCQRRFSSKAAARHIPLCANIVNRPTSLQRGSGRKAHQRV